MQTFRSPTKAPKDFDVKKVLTLSFGVTARAPKLDKFGNSYFS